MARLLPSVAPEVQTISFGSALISAATCPRASSTASSAFQPNACERLAALPKCSVRYGIIFSRHARIDRRGRGVVEVDRQLHAATFSAATFSGVGPEILDHRHRLAALVRDQVGERHRREVLVHLLVQRRPQVVRHAALVVVAVLLAAALRRVERLVDRGDDVGHRDALRRLREVVAAAGAAHARHQLGAAQLAEQLLEVGKRNVLALADGGERHRAAVLAHRQIDHRGDREPAFGGESHGGFLIPD